MLLLFPWGFLVLEDPQHGILLQRKLNRLAKWLLTIARYGKINNNCLYMFFKRYTNDYINCMNLELIALTNVFSPKELIYQR